MKHVGEVSNFTLESVASNEGTSLEEKIESGLKEKNVLLEDETLESYKEVDGWERTGGETFCGVFEIKGSGEEEFQRKVVGKAVHDVGGCGWRTENMKERWLSIRKKGGSVVPVYKFDVENATIYQEHLPEEVHKNLDNLTKGALIDVGKTGAVLDEMGFHPNNFLRDMRAKGKGAYLIDFGKDLGGRRETSTDRCKKEIEGTNETVARAYEEKVENFS